MNYRFAALRAGVVVVGPGAPFKVFATWYAAADLEKAAAAGILQKRKLGGSLVLDIYAVKQTWSESGAPLPLLKTP